jgi:polysaccharide deacetylase family protein (PEP-CTERM system associated)
MGRVMNALTVDVEEYYHGLEFEAAVPPAERQRLPSRVEGSVERILEILDAARTRATFFVLGSVAEAHPVMIRRIAAQGHEIACHGYGHRLVWRQTPEEFRVDVARAKGILEDLVGRAVLGYRAPNYSINRSNAWALDVLLAQGFRYDSSVYPIHHDRYGIPDAPRFPHVVRRRDGRELWELPIGTVKLLGVNLPIGGGGPFRLFPYHYFRAGIRAVNRREGRGVVFYLHPWELDPDQPRPPMPFHHRVRHYVNLHRLADKLRRLLADIPFGPAADLLEVHEIAV